MAKLRPLEFDDVPVVDSLMHNYLLADKYVAIIMNLQGLLDLTLHDAIKRYMHFKEGKVKDSACQTKSK